MLFPVFFDTLHVIRRAGFGFGFAVRRIDCIRRIGHRVCWMSWNECWVSALAKIKPASVFAR